MNSSIFNKINKIYFGLGLETTIESIFDETISKTLVLDSLADSSLYVGDNLGYLRAFSEKFPDIVDFCYIDPPYNTGSKFLYHDNRKTVSSGCFSKHGEWMSFMLPRLICARELLKQDGIIAISIDDYEYAYLKILMDNIYGEENFIGSVIVCRSKNGKGSKKNIATSHEYLLIYGKTPQALLVGQPDDDASYDKVDEYGNYKVDGLFRKKGEASLRPDRPNMFYPLYFNPQTGYVSVDSDPELSEVYPVDSKGIERRWLWSKDTARERSWQLYASGKGIIYVKNYSKKGKRTKVRTIWNETAFYTERATNEIKEIYGEKVFDTPKPLSYISTILDYLTKSDSLILDFFAGSATTAHAAALLNAKDAGTRKTILMENDTIIPEKHIAHKSGFNNISEITSFRLEKIKDTLPDFNYKVFRK